MSEQPPDRTPKALRLAIQEHAPHLLPDFEAHWHRTIGDAFDLAAVPAFMRLWETQYAIARTPGLEAHLADLEARAAQSQNPKESEALLAEFSRLRRQAAGQPPEDDAPERTKEQRLLELAEELCHAYTYGVGYDETLQESPEDARKHMDAAHALLPYIQAAPREERRAAFRRGWDRGKERQAKWTAEDMRRLEQENAELRAEHDPEEIRQRFRDLQRAWEELYRGHTGRYDHVQARELSERAVRAERQRDEALFKLAQLGHPNGVVEIQDRETPAHVGGNAEDCPACDGTNPPYPFLCPGPS
ncbi:hypothetical protein [Streptomyces sp. Wb2n-11]|uniref:hypothetical protein n=1 Tax=Streptomyces sp. Wb2n-11 TaxID=1030533 RepID=UPI000B20EC0A